MPLVLFAHLDELSGLDGTKSAKAGRDVRKNVPNAARLGSNHENCDVATGQVLLVLHALIERDEYFEVPRRQSQQLAVRLACKARFRNRGAFMSID